MNPRYFNPNFRCYCSNSQRGGADVKQQIIIFFKQNPYPTDNQVHDFAKKMGINKHKFEEMIYAILTEMLVKQQ